MQRAKCDAPEVWTHESAERAFSQGSPLDICSALVAVTLQDGDRVRVKGWLRRLATHSDVNVRGLVATCIGHAARIRGALDPKLADPVLDRLGAEPELAGRVADVRDDPAMFLHRTHPR